MHLRQRPSLAKPHRVWEIPPNLRPLASGRRIAADALSSYVTARYGRIGEVQRAGGEGLAAAPEPRTRPLLTLPAYEPRVESWITEGGSVPDQRSSDPEWARSELMAPRRLGLDGGPAVDDEELFWSQRSQKFALQNVAFDKTPRGVRPEPRVDNTVDAREQNRFAMGKANTASSAEFNPEDPGNYNMDGVSPAGLSGANLGERIGGVIRDPLGFSFGALKGAVNLLPELAVATSKGWTYGGALISDAVGLTESALDRTVGRFDSVTGTVWAPSNDNERFGGLVGGPVVLAGGLKFGRVVVGEFGIANSAPELVEGAYSLAGANRAIIDPRKLTEYALNPAHPVGGNKARVFDSALGFTRNNADDLMGQLRQGVTNNSAVAGKVDQFGARFTVDIPMTGPAGSAVVRSGWIYKPGSNVPELTTIFVK